MYLRGKNIYRETLVYANYYAPRGRERLYMLGSELSQRYLLPSDFLIGIIGAEGSGKSTLIQGLFPGLHLTNDDDGINMQSAPLYDFDQNNYLTGHTFHIDVRYELAFKQMHDIVFHVNNAVSHGRRVIVEHFDLLYEALGYNAHILFGVGEEVIVARPNIFGPFPKRIKDVVNKTIKFRLMAHSAEDITTYILAKEYNYKRDILHSDIKHGFVINFSKKPDISPHEIEEKVQNIINQNIPIKIIKEDKIKIGNMEIYCTGTRTHVKSTGEIKNFRLLEDLQYDPLSKEYLLVGIVGNNEKAGFDDIMEIYEKNFNIKSKQ